MAKKFVFEEAMGRLEEIIGMLEQGDAPLDESLALFEEATGLIKKCGSALDKAEQKVSMLVRTEEGPAEVPFDLPDEEE